MIDDEFAVLENLFVSSVDLNNHAGVFPVLDKFTREVGRVLDIRADAFLLVVFWPGFS